MNTMRIFFILLFSIFLIVPKAFALDNGVLDVTNITPQTVAAFFKPALSLLKQKKIAIKVLVPSFIPDAMGKGFLYATATFDRPDRYGIYLSYNQKCNLSNACDYIYLKAEKFGFKYQNGRVDIIPLEDDLAVEKSLYSEVPLDNRYPNPPTWVTLHNGKRATFSRLLKHTNANLSWDDSGVRYLILMKDGEKEQMLKMANSIYD